jgi:hypothetical protein
MTGVHQFMQRHLEMRSWRNASTIERHKIKINTLNISSYPNLPIISSTNFPTTLKATREPQVPQEQGSQVENLDPIPQTTRVFV